MRGKMEDKIINDKALEAAFTELKKYLFIEDAEYETRPIHQGSMKHILAQALISYESSLEKEMRELKTPSFVLDSEDGENSADVTEWECLCEYMDLGEIKQIDYYNHIHCGSKYAVRVADDNGMPQYKLFDTEKEALAEINKHEGQNGK